MTAVHLRFGLKAASFFNAGNTREGLEFIKIGAARITEALAFVQGQNNLLKQTYAKERLGWNAFYDALTALQDALKKADPFALELKRKAREIIRQCHIRIDPE